MKRLSEKLLARFRIADIGDETIGLYLRNGDSLAICCRDCPRLVEWTPYDLAAKFGEHPDLKIAAIASRLTCSGPDGCGSHDIVVYPHVYDGKWTWPPDASEP